MKDLRLVAEKSTYGVSSWDYQNGRAQVRMFNSDGSPFHGCPRFLLETALRKLKARSYELRVGYEIEF